MCFHVSYYNMLKFFYGLLYCFLAALLTILTTFLWWYVFELPAIQDRPGEDT